MADNRWDIQDYPSVHLEAIATERREWQADKAAWQEFRKRIRNLAKAPEGVIPIANRGQAIHADAGMGTMATNVDHIDRLQRRIRTAYTETVMATPAADEMERVPAEHMAAELGPDITNAVLISANPPSNLLAMIRRASTCALRSRDRVIEKLDDEESNVESLTEDLLSVRDEVGTYDSIYPAISFKGLVVYHQRLGELRQECASIARRRQEEFHTTFPGDYTRFEWSEYLYRDCEVAHPVLAAVAETVAEIDEFRHRLRLEVVNAEGNLGPPE